MTNKDFCKTIGYRFKDPGLLTEALTHSSYANEHGHDGTKLKFNERLEFFGDAILEFLCSELLFSRYKDLPEGTLTKMRAAAVCEESLAALGRQIGLGEALYLGKGEELNGGRENPSIIADAFEALLAAVYLDGGRGAAEDFLYPLLIPQIRRTSSGNRDYKSLLQQFIQKESGEFVEYVLEKEEGPDHNKTFYMTVKYQNNIVGRGTGKSKRAAEQAAAHDALVLFGELPDEP